MNKLWVVVAKDKFDLYPDMFGKRIPNEIERQNKALFKIQNRDLFDLMT